MRIHLGSAIRSGSIAAVLAGLLLLFVLTPFFGSFVTVLLIAGIILFPLGAGFYYGYLAPGRETVFQSAFGGALSGMAGGIVLGIAFGLNEFTRSAVSTGLLGQAIVSSLTITILAAAMIGVFGALMGAIGGILWKIYQGQSQPA